VDFFSGMQKLLAKPDADAAPAAAKS
jgi:hypothetical protein